MAVSKTDRVSSLTGLHERKSMLQDCSVVFCLRASAMAAPVSSLTCVPCKSILQDRSIVLYFTASHITCNISELQDRTVSEDRCLL